MRNRPIGHHRILIVLSGVFIVLAFLAACAKQQQAVPAEFLSPTYPMKQSLIESGDLLSVRFYYTPELNDNIIVRPDGKISLTLFQGLTVAGLTPDQLQQKLVELYSSEFKAPVITVHLDKRNTSMVFVTGEVGSGGAKPLVSNMTISQVLAQSAPLTKRADLKSTVLIRQVSEKNFLAYKLDVDWESGKDRDVYMAPGDIVYVPKDFITSLGDFIQKDIGNLVPPTVTVALGLQYDLYRKSPY
jgi:polysaccharide biosynthesis/export protein